MRPDLTEEAKNILYLLRVHPKLRALAKSSVASQLGVNQSTLSRWQTGTSQPSDRNVRNIAANLGLDSDLLHKKHIEFRVIFADMDNAPRRAYTDFRQSVTLYSSDKWKHLWNESFGRHKGAYLLYCRIPGRDGEQDSATVALLNILRLTDRGIMFEIHDTDDRYRRASGKIGYYYTGLMFPIRDSLFFVGDEESGDEPLAMLTSATQKRPPSLLTGHILAVGANAAEHLPMARKLALAFHSNSPVHASVARGLMGIVPMSEIPDPIQEFI